MEAKAAKRPKKIEEVVQYALGHKTRVHILIILNDGIYTAAQLAQMIDEPLNNITNHLSKMLEDGSVEVADEERIGNVVRYRYRAVEIPYYSQETAEEMTQLQRQMTVGAIVQSGSAEVMAALYAGKLADPRAVVYWDWYNVDEQGREELEAENHRYLERIREVEVRSTNRRAKSGENPISMLVNLTVFQRVRKARDDLAPS
ncbi:MAG TPA: winged helix-turn-helix domain-containing protein [Solirubrobacterales bacterium]|nr:winged helix-turn-helix domain-containing protein [Solirubrobacterales bacterium]